ncbi:isoamylase early set domain-containing protein [Streptosporangium lutulentum]
MIKRGKPMKNGQVKLTFVVPNDKSIGGISLVGDFNNWDPYAHPMERMNNGTYQVSLTVSSQQPIRFRYLADGGVWFDDADADHHDEHGGRINPACLENSSVKNSAVKNSAVENSAVENSAAAAIKKAVRRLPRPGPRTGFP